MVLSNNLKPQILNAYNLQTNNSEIIYNGVNKLFRTSTVNNSYILKIFKNSIFTKNQISFQRNIMFHLCSKGIESIRPIAPTSNNEQVYTFEHQAYYGILTYENSGELYASNTDNFYDFLFGQALYRLHNCPLPILKNPRNYLNDAHHFISKLNKSTGSPLTERLKQIILDLFHDIELTRARPPKGHKHCICHGDAWPGNALYHATTCTLLDFEHTRIFDPTFDIATFIWWLTDIEYSEAQKHAAWDSFKDGYGEDIKSLINHNTSTYIKANQLRSLLFLFNHIIIDGEILEYVQQKTSNLLHRLTPNLNQEQLLGALWAS